MRQNLFGSSLAIFLTLLLGLGITSQVAYGQRKGKPAVASAGMVYPQFKLKDGRVCRWIPQQMPLKVYVSRGSCLDQFIDEGQQIQITCVDNTAGWPDLVAKLVSQSPETVLNLPVANGFNDSHFQAAVQGINQWKGFQNEGLYSFDFTNDPGEADIYVFWTHHFVNKLGMGLFANDIRGYTAKYMLGPVNAILAHPERANFKPVVILLRTSEQTDNPMPFGKMKAAAAHEFGHALGIDGHSANPVDLMSINYGRGVISGNDAATIRYLYRSAPHLIP